MFVHPDQYDRTAPARRHRVSIGSSHNMNSASRPVLYRLLQPASVPLVSLAPHALQEPRLLLLPLPLPLAAAAVVAAPGRPPAAHPPTKPDRKRPPTCPLTQ